MRRLSPYLLIIVLSLFVYFPTLFFGFTNWDDDTLIISRHGFLSDFSNLPKVFNEKVFHNPLSVDFYRPLLTLSFMIDAHFSGISPFIYHLSNVIYHLIACCLIYLLLIRLKYNSRLSFIASIFFLIHPALTQVIAWIPGRNDSLLAIFVISSFLFYQSFLEHRKRSLFIWSLFFFLLALFTKEVAVFFPPVCLCYYWLIYRGRSWPDLLRQIIGWSAMLAFWLIMRMHALAGPQNQDVFNAFLSLVSHFPTLFAYIYKIIIPVNLSVFPISDNLPIIPGLVTAFIIFLIVVFSKNKRVEYVVFGLFWFLFFLVPTFINPTSFLFLFLSNENRLYLPMVGLIFILLEIDLIKNFRFHQLFFYAFILLLFFFFLILTFFHMKDFRNPLIFWKSAVASSPNSFFVHNNLGKEYYNRDLFAEAKKEYLAAIQLYQDKTILFNLASTHLAMGENEAAKKIIFPLIGFYPNFYRGRLVIGQYYLCIGNSGEAEKQYIKAISIDPENGQAYQRLATLYYNKKDFKKATFYRDQARKRGMTIPKILDTF